MYVRNKDFVTLLTDVATTWSKTSHYDVI